MYDLVPPPGGGKEKVMKVTNRKKNRHSHTDNGDADHAGADGKRIG